MSNIKELKVCLVIDKKAYAVLDSIAQSVEHKDIPLTVSEKDYAYLLSYIGALEVNKALSNLVKSQMDKAAEESAKDYSRS